MKPSFFWQSVSWDMHRTDEAWERETVRKLMVQAQSAAFPENVRKPPEIQVKTTQEIPEKKPTFIERLMDLGLLC